MDPRKGYYCLIQYCPDASRAEAANVGVLLFCPDERFIAARTAEGNDRVRRFFRGAHSDLREINAAKRALESRVEKEADRFRTLDDLRAFIASRGNELTITEPRPVRVVEPARDLDELFEELVGGRARRDRERRERSRPRVLEEVFTRLHAQQRGEFDRRIQVPFLHRELVARYAYRNGGLNLVRPHLFSASHAKAASDALRLASEARLVNLHPDEVGESAKVIVVSAGVEARDVSSLAAPDIEEAVRPIFRDHEVQFVPFDELTEFAKRVEAEARG